MTLSLGFEDVATMGDAVQDRAGEAFAAEHLGPVFKGQVCCDE